MNILKEMWMKFNGWEKPNKSHPSINCRCEDCSTTTDLQGR